MKVSIKPIGKPILTSPDYITILQRVMKEEAREVRLDFEKTVSTWKKKPVFTLVKNGDYGFDVATDNEIYGYVDEGTEPHIIAAKNAPSLAFPTKPPFRSKTLPGRLSAKAGQKPSTNYVFPKVVNHPGMKARDFSGQIKKKSQDRIIRKVVAALKQANRRKS